MNNNYEREYIVLKHNLRGVNLNIFGVRFRHGYAVVEKNSKVHRRLKQCPNLRNAVELPLTSLGSLPFITRSKDIISVYGKDVYRRYLVEVEREKERQKEKEEKEREEILNKKIDIEAKIDSIKSQISSECKEELQEELKKLEEEKKLLSVKCSYRTLSGKLCKYDALEESPSGYCRMHLLEDPKLSEYGIVIPKIIAKDEKKELKEKVIRILQKRRTNK